MSREVTPPEPPGQRRPQNWLGLGCYAGVALVVLLFLLLAVGLCSGQGIHEQPR